MIVQASTNPENEACVVLAARGLSGRLVTRWKGSPHDATTRDIVAAARVAVAGKRRKSPAPNPASTSWLKTILAFMQRRSLTPPTPRNFTASAA